ncbi:nuclear transport factor 2 family protein [Vibrio sp. ZSDE26]|uniref:Nuclear transport factor 2 family protein n=1 Tax=Vibrio amylolyticus TaxID=2847292 RepID=A0A9X1XNJ7_9VIBR|nr:nuclear transport factor 2 family protein [Vibrio amylolyticus]MCK6264235.1 nuclear transport factor 2 family protein [Vibrio amylolyticus]
MNNPTEYIQALYQIVDNRDVIALSELLHPEISFRFGNADPVQGKDSVVDVNHQFFDSIAKMGHSFDGIWQQDDVIICNGEVNYVRKDGSFYAAKFATFLTIKEGLIIDYKIYADVSQLYATNT